MPRKFRGYANNTQVPVEKSQMEVMKILRREGAEQTFFGQDAAKAVVGFTCHGRQVRISIPLPAPSVRGGEHEICRRWRCLVLAISAKFEAVRSEISTFEMEFQPNIVMPNGKTVGEMVGPLISAAYQSGTMPKMLLSVGGSS